MNLTPDQHKQRNNNTHPSINPLLTFITISALIISILYNALIQLIISPLKYFNQSLHYKLILLLKSIWTFSLITLLQTISKTKFILKSSFPLNKISNNLILISNHQLYADWILLWQLSLYFLSDTKLIIIMKDELLKIPIISFAMKNFNFIFLKRKWTEDCATLKISLEKLKKMSFWLLLFPEGTTIHPSTIEKGREYLKKNDLVFCEGKEERVLVPRSTGLLYCLKELKTNVLDVTMIIDGKKELKEMTKNLNDASFFPENIYSLWNWFFCGKQPETIYYFLNYYEQDLVGNVISSDDKFQEWLFGVYERKNKLLCGFYNDEIKEEEYKYEDEIRLSLFMKGVVLFVWGLLFIYSLFGFYWSVKWVLFYVGLNK